MKVKELSIIVQRSLNNSKRYGYVFIEDEEGNEVIRIAEVETKI